MSCAYVHNAGHLNLISSHLAGSLTTSGSTTSKRTWNREPNRCLCQESRCRRSFHHCEYLQATVTKQRSVLRRKRQPLPHLRMRVLYYCGVAWRDVVRAHPFVCLSVARQGIQNALCAAHGGVLPVGAHLVHGRFGGLLRRGCNASWET